MSVIDQDGKSVSLFSLWATRRIVIVFTRHMGCRFCKEQVSELKKIQPTLANDGISVVVITVGKYEDIVRFKTENHFDGEVYVDSSLLHPACYKAMKLANGPQYLFAADDSVASTEDGDSASRAFLPKTVEAAVRAAGKGFQDGGYGSAGAEFTGDTLQIGGGFVLGPGNNCDYSYRCSYVGDLVDLNKLVTAATGKNVYGEEVFHTRTLDWNAKLNIHLRADGVAASTQRPLRSKYNPGNPSQLRGFYLYTAVLVGVLSAVLVAVTQAHQTKSNDESVETVLLAAGGAVSLIIVTVFVRDLRRWQQVKSSLIPKKNEQTSPIVTPDVCPVKGTTVSVQTLPPDPDTSFPSIHGCPLYTLSAIDKMVMSASGEVDCDCSFLEDVDMTHLREKGNNESITSSASKSTVHTDVIDSSSVHHESSSTDGSAVSSTVSCPAFPTLHPISSTLASDHTISPSVTARGPHPSHTALSAEALSAAQSTLCYVREFLAKPNPNLGRSGPTCPFVPKSLQLDTLYFSVLSASEARTPKQLEDILMDAIPVFHTLEPKLGPKASYKAIILIFPDLPLSEVPEMIDGTQKRLKPRFVEEGLMLGEFHLHNNATGLHNVHFYPLRTPYPCLAIRHMVPSDVVFLNPVEFPPAVRLQMLTSFVSKFGHKASNDAQTEVAKKLLHELHNAVAN